MRQKFSDMIHKILMHKWFQPLWALLFFTGYLIMFCIWCKTIDLALMCFWIGWGIQTLMAVWYKQLTDESREVRDDLIEFYKRIANNREEHAGMLRENIAKQRQIIAELQAQIEELKNGK